MSSQFITTGIYNLKTIRFLDYVVHITPDIFVKHRHLDLSKLFEVYNLMKTTTAIFGKDFLTNEYDDYESILLEKGASSLLDSFKGQHKYKIFQHFGFLCTGEAYIQISDKFFRLANVDVTFNKKFFKNMFADIVEAFLEIRNLNELYDEEFLNDKITTAHKTLKWLTDQQMTANEINEVIGTPLNSFESVLMNEYMQERDKYKRRSFYDKNTPEFLKAVRNKITKLLARECECLEK